MNIVILYFSLQNIEYKTYIVSVSFFCTLCKTFKFLYFFTINKKHFQIILLLTYSHKRLLYKSVYLHTQVDFWFWFVPRFPKQYLRLLEQLNTYINHFYIIHLSGSRKKLDFLKCKTTIVLQNSFTNISFSLRSVWILEKFKITFHLKNKISVIFWRCQSSASQRHPNGRENNLHEKGVR